MKRIIAHWDADDYTIDRSAREHYHRIIDGQVVVHEGDHPISDNESTSDGIYAAHTRACNTGSIGIAVLCMAGAKENFQHGEYPMKEVQFEKLCEEMAILCQQYNIGVSSLTTLTHAEVEPNLGIWQRGKWDIAELSFRKDLKGAKDCGDYMRERIRHYMGDVVNTLAEDTQTFLNDMGAKPMLTVDGDFGPKSEAAWNTHRSKL